MKLVLSCWLLISLISIGYADVNLKYLDAYGSITYYLTGSDISVENIICVAYPKPSPKGKFIWELGNDILYDHVETETNENEEISTLSYIPKIEDSEKPLRCKYDQNNGAILSQNPTPLQILVEKRILPQSPFKVDQPMEFGGRQEISLEMELNPTPTDKDIAWKIKEPSNEPFYLRPGDSHDKYATEVDFLNGDKTVAKLYINNFSEQDLRNKYFLELKPGTADNLEVEVEFKPRSQPQVSTQAPDMTTEKITTAGPGAGIYVIIILVILIILACVGYCIYQKFYNKKDPKGEYDKANTEANDPPNAKNDNNQTTSKEEV